MGIRKKRAFWAFAVIVTTFIGGWNVQSHADEIVCPKSVAAIQEDFINQAVKGVLARLYQDMGCTTSFADLPAKRGIMYFNNGQVDGEVFRLRQVETLYTRAFVRTEAPLFILSNSLWLHPELKASERHPLGYLAGIVWQENYMKGRHGRYFHRPHEMYDAYNKGELRGFLATDISVNQKIQDGYYTPSPEHGEVLLAKPIYHYVAAEYAPFIAALSRELKGGSFSAIGVADRP